jgi:transcriptional regulator with XRE-family HTH domain
VRAVDATPEQCRDFGAALERALDGRHHGGFGADVARAMGAKNPFTPSAVSQWVNGTVEPARPKVFAMEKVLKLRPGSLSRLLGYLPVTARASVSVLEAIDADPSLSETQKGMLRAAYRAAVGRDS